MCMFLMNLMNERISSGSAVRTTCDMKKEATPETLCTLLPPRVVEVEVGKRHPGNARPHNSWSAFGDF